MIIRSRIAVPMLGEPIENAAVAIVGNQISEVGRFSELKSTHAGTVLDLGEQILLPGFINAHCHLDYTILRNCIPSQDSFTDWVNAINAAKSSLSEDDYIGSINAGVAEAESFGTTALLNLEAVPDLIPRIAQPSLRIWWCAEMIDVRKAVEVTEIANRLREWFTSHPRWRGGFGLAPHALYTASDQMISCAAEISREYRVPFTTHLAESHEEMQMFHDASGYLFQFMKGIGRPMADCGGNTPLSLLLENHAPDERWVMAHLNELTEEDFDRLALAKKFSIAHCPRSHRSFRHSSFPLQRLRSLGFNICLGTDSLASNSSLSLFAEMRELLQTHPSISPREALAMATVNSAQALGQSDSLGMIAPGFRADLIGIPCSESTDGVFDKIAAFDGTVSWMMIDGQMPHC